MRRAMFLTALLAIGAGAAIAQTDPIAARKEAMKAMGAAAGAAAKMMRGENAFDLAKVKAGLEAIQRSAKASPALYPDTSKSGDTKALPAVWEQKQRFGGLFAKLDSDAGAALAAIKDEASFKAEIGKVLGNCAACHNDFRAK